MALFHGKENIFEVDFVHSYIDEIKEVGNALVVSFEMKFTSNKTNGELTFIEQLGGKELINFMKDLTTHEIDDIKLIEFKSKKKMIYEFTFEFSETPSIEKRVICNNYWWKRASK